MTDDSRKQDSQPRSAVMKAPPSDKVILGVTARVNRPDPSSTQRSLPAGVGMGSMAPSVDVKSLSVTAFDSTQKSMELRDNKNHMVRLKQQGPADYQLELLGPRGKAEETHQITTGMAKDILEVVYQSVLRNMDNPLLAASMQSAKEWVQALAEVASVKLGTSNVAAPVIAMPTTDVASHHHPAKPWAGFSGSTVETRAPSMKEKVTASVSTEQILLVARGLDVDTLGFRSIDSSKSYVEMEDAAGNFMTLRQTKFSPPPVFEVGYMPSGGSLEKKQVKAALARELSHLLDLMMERDDAGPDAPRFKPVRAMMGGLLKVA